MLLGVPNVSEGRDAEAIDAIGRAFVAGGHARLLDVHRDPDHHRSVFTLAGEPGRLAQALLSGAREVVARVDLGAAAGTGGGGAPGGAAPPGIHPHVGALDVAPIVHLSDSDLGAACAEALTAADLIGHHLGMPVFLYGALGGNRTRAELRRGGPSELQHRMAQGDLIPDFGPPELHPTAGATLVAARPPLVAFNLELAPPATHEDAERIAAAIREGGSEGLHGVRALGLWLDTKQRAQVSLNVERPDETPLRTVVDAVRRHAPTAAGELVGLAPKAALASLPDDLPLPGFDPARHLIENALSS